MIEQRPDDQSRQDTMQRIQVGIVGLVAVLLLVSVINFVQQRASDEPTAIEQLQADAEGMLPNLIEDSQEVPAEPLAELGITPAPQPDEEDVEPALAPVGPSAQTVPDLKPDPKLEARMDRESQ